MQAKEWIKKLLVRTCICFTVTTFLLLVLYLILAKTEEGMRPLAMILILPFSLCFSSGNMLLRCESLQRSLAVVLHYILTVGGVFLCLYLPMRQPGASASGAVVFFALLTLIYVIVMGVIAIVKGRAKRLKRDSKEYKSIYKK